jgi:hypothetical protein
MFPLLPMQIAASNSFHGTFVPGRGIFPHIPTHLTVLGAVGVWCDLDFGRFAVNGRGACEIPLRPKNGFAQDDSLSGSGDVMLIV